MAFPSDGVNSPSGFVERTSMLLGGLQRQSLIDYPGKISCICFLAGCNFRCPYCHNPHLVTGDANSIERVPEEEFFRFLERRKEFLDGVVLSGGEPTLEARLPVLCDKIKGLGFDVKLDTNGSNPEVLRHLLDKGLVDYIAMDLKTDPERYPSLMKGACKVEDILESVRIVMNAPIPHEFRTTCVRLLVDEEILGRMAEIIRGTRCYALQPFHPARILNPAYFQGEDPGYDPDEMNALRAVAAPFVEECFVRG